MDEHITKVKSSDPQLRYLQVQYSKREIFVNNLIGGIAWGLGATVGISLLLTILGLFLHYINFVPFIGSYITSIVDYVNQNRTTFPR